MRGVGGAPVGQLLGAGGFGVGVGGGTEHPDEELHRDELAGIAVDQVGVFAGEIEKDLLEPRRVYRRLQLLRGLEHEQIKSIFPRG